MSEGGFRRGRCLLVVVVAVGTLAPAVWAGAPETDPRVTPVVRAYRRAGPAVVNISTQRLVAARWGLFGTDAFGLDDIFPRPLLRRVPVKSLGSGFVLHRAGYVVTNAHVIDRAEEITVRFADKTKYAAEVISTEPAHDLAVLKIAAGGGKKLPYLPLGRSDDLMVGETVIAIGNPFGLANSLTTGVISATERTLTFRGGLRYEHLIQTDAPINPGSSGGPLLNIKGQLIGINTAIRADAENIGFAIPVDRLAAELTRLLDFERLNRVVFGATVVDARIAGLDKPPGLYVTAVRADTPAEKRLQVGDRLVAVNGAPVRQVADYVCEIVSASPGAQVRLRLVRAGKERSVSVPLRIRPRPDGNALAGRLFGLTLRKITPALARELRLATESGLLVVAVAGGSPADRLGVKPRDVLFQVGKFYVADLDDLGMILEDVQAGDSLKIGILRGRVRAWTRIRARKAPGGDA